MKKKILYFLLGILLFAAVVAGSFSAAQQLLPQPERDQLYYTRPQTEPTESHPETEPTTEPTLPPVVTEATLPPETEPVYQRNYYDQVPLYDQTQYTGIRYRAGTVATSGSNIVSLAMAASYLTGEEYLPEELADWFANFIGNPMEWVEHASDQLQLPWKRAANIDVTLQALREGKIAVVVMKDKSIFRDVQHFVVFTGINEEGKILVNDPYQPNYESWNLKNALANGFNRGDLTGSYAGAWIYDPAEVGEQPFIYAPVDYNLPSRYPGLELSEEDVKLIAQLVWAEASSEPFEGQQGVAEVILNRLKADNFPDTVRGVIFAEGQFLAADKLYLAQLTHTQYEAVERALNGPYILPEDVVFFSQWAVNENVWGKIGKHVFCHAW